MHWMFEAKRLASYRVGSGPIKSRESHRSQAWLNGMMRSPTEDIAMKYQCNVHRTSETLGSSSVPRTSPPGA